MDHSISEEDIIQDSSTVLKQRRVDAEECRTTRRFRDANLDYFKKNLRRLKKCAKIVDTWQKILPEGMREHCDILEIKNGEIKVEVESATYMHEMRLMSCELIEHLCEKCGQGKVKKIKLVPIKPKEELHD